MPAYLRKILVSDIAPNELHGYIGMGWKSFRNPDHARCACDGFSLQLIATIPFFTAFGVPILIARSISGNN